MARSYKDVDNKRQKELKRIKDNIQTGYDYFRKNYERFNACKRFVHVSSLDDTDVKILRKLKKPVIEFNILEAYVSRLRGEFSKQEPSFDVKGEYGSKVDQSVLEMIEGHLRHIESQAKNDNVAWEVYTDLLTGGFSVMEVTTDYLNDKSMQQIIKNNRAYDPCMCGFDPLARFSHKGDGRYCFKIVPKSKQDMEQEYPELSLDDLKFNHSSPFGKKGGAEIGSFNWSYKAQEEEILLLVEYYEKKNKSKKLCKLSDGQTMYKDEYEKMMQDSQVAGSLLQPPIIVEERETKVTTICRYKIIESEVIEYVETDFAYFPLVFIDGNSVICRESENGQVQQVCRPYIYHAMGVQRLKNFAGQTLANELENMVQHKYKVPKEGIPDAYKEQYRDVQQSTLLIYNQYKNDDPNVPLNPPQEIARVPAPPEVSTAFSVADQTSQMILGSYDASLGINDNQLSGVAVVEAATQSNAAAMPYVVGYMNGYSRVAQINLDLIPKYWTDERIVPGIDKAGKGQNYNFHPDMIKNVKLNVTVSAGVSFAVQKHRALQQILALGQTFPLLQQMLQTEPECLNVILDNVEMRGIDRFKDIADRFAQKLMMAQQQKQPSPEMLELQRKMKKDEVDSELGSAKVMLEAEKIANTARELKLKEKEVHANMEVQLDKHQSENLRSAVNMAVEVQKMEHQHFVDHHDVALKHKDHELKRYIATKPQPVQKKIK
jgi:hypothetical protein